jgi:hypothetical protein
MAATKPYQQSAVNFIVSYALLFSIAALLKLSTPLWGQPVWLFGSMPWPEIFVGPLIAIAVAYACPCTADYLLQCRRRRQESTLD